MLLFVVLAFLLSVNSQGLFNDFQCDNVTLSPLLWKARFPTNYAFNGFFRADGSIKILDPNGNTLFAVNLDGSVWHQYFANNGYQIGELYLNGLAPVLVLTSRQISNPMFLQGKICQNFLAPSPPNLIASYSELMPFGKGYMTSVYYNRIDPNINTIFSNEFFSFDYDLKTAFSETNNFAMGNGNENHYVAQTVNFRYTPITEAQAIALGYTGNNLQFNSTRGIACGRAGIPIEIFPLAQRALLK